MKNDHVNKLTEVKVYIEQQPKKVFFSFNLEEIKNFAELKKQAVLYSNSKKFFQELNLDFKMTDILKFEFTKDYWVQPKNNRLDGFWNKETFLYSKERLMKEKIYKEVVKLFVKKIKGELQWNPPRYPEYLKSALNCSCQNEINNLKKEINSMKINDYKVEFDKEMSIKNPVIVIRKHKGIICNNCLSFDFPGKRFVCSECENYNLCEKCESSLTKEKFHNEKHIFIQINFPIKSEGKKYSNIIYKKIFISNKDLEEINFNIVNNTGDKLEECFFQPIRYGPEYLKCKKKLINVIKRDETINVKLPLEYPEKKEKSIEGFFRMFTKEGLPFGEIIKVFIR